MNAGFIIGGLLLLMFWFFWGRLFFLNRKESKGKPGGKVMEQLIGFILVVGTLSLVLSYLL
jgi:hypothetical protein